ncbi:MAG: alpha/beta hydrolase [Haloplanus sp.]
MSIELDPQVETYLHQLSAEGVPPLYTLPVSEARDTYRRLCVVDDPDPAVETTDQHVPGPAGAIPIRIYDPEARDGPVVAFFHGGGWLLGGLDTHDALCRALADAAGTVVVAVDYRRAPEHRFPAPLTDCYAATEWIAASAESLGDGDLVLVGDSAGGNLAAGVALLAARRDGPTIDRQVLAYPVTNHAFDTDSYTENAQGYFLTRADMERFWNAYLRSDADGRHPYASPLRVERPGDLPPTTVLTCGFDPLRDEGKAYADQLAEAGVPTTHRSYDDVIHGFLTMLDDPDLDRARDAIDDIAADIRG